MIKLTKMIYIASPYSCKLDRKKEIKRYNDITRIIGELQDKFPYAFIGPITQSHNTAKFMKEVKTTFDSWEIRDYTYINKCDELWVVMLEGWDLSNGVTKELIYADSLNKKIRFYEPFIEEFIKPSEPKGRSFYEPYKI